MSSHIYHIILTPFRVVSDFLFMFINIAILFHHKATFFFSFIYFFIFILYNIVLVLPYIDMNPPWVYMCSPSWTPLPPPSPSYPSVSSQCISPRHPVSCIKPGLAIRFTWYFTCFTAILPYHPALALSHKAQKTVLCICVSFAVSHTGLLLPSF